MQSRTQIATLAAVLSALIPLQAHAQLDALLRNSMNRYRQQQQRSAPRPNYNYAAQRQAADNRAADQRYDMAMSYMVRGNMAEAIRRFMEVLRWRPNDGDALYQLGVCYEAIGNFDEASHYYSQVESTHGRYQEAQKKIGAIASGVAQAAYEANAREQPAADPYTRNGAMTATAMSPYVRDNVDRRRLDPRATGSRNPYYPVAPRATSAPTPMAAQPTIAPTARVSQPQTSAPTPVAITPSYTRATPPVVPAATTPTVSAATSQAIELYNQGLKAFRENSRDAALSCFQRALSIDPNLADAHYNLAVLYMQQDRLADSMKHFREVIRIRPGDDEAHYRLAVLCERIGDIREAVKQYTMVPNSSGHYGEAQANLIALATKGSGQRISAPAATSAPIKPAPTPLSQTPAPAQPPVQVAQTPVASASPPPASRPAVAVATNSTPLMDISKSVNRPIKDKWALIVGISNFADSTINLKYAAKDALDFKDFLIQKANFAPDHVRTLIDKDATRERILDEFGDSWLPRVAGPDDLVVVYISTHGTPAEVDVGQVNYILAHDTDKTKLFSRGIPMQELCRLIKSRVSCDRVLIVLDTCFSGNTAPTGKSLSRTGNFSADEIALGTGQLVICSSSTNQRSWESKQYENGIFTRKLIESLQTNGSKTTLGQAFAALKDKVEDEARREYGATQTPCMNGRWSGKDLILAVPPAGPKPGL